MSSPNKKSRIVRLLFGLTLTMWLQDIGFAQNPAVYEGVQKNEFLRQWLVLGPIPIGPEPRTKLDEDFQRKAFTTDWLISHGGEAAVTPNLSATLTISRKTYHWQAVKSAGDAISLESLFAKPNYAVAYAACDIVVPEAASMLLAVGSDDAVKIWLNGEKVHDHWALRGVEKDDDLVAGRSLL